MGVSDDELDLRETPSQPGSGNQHLEESAVDVATVVGAAAAVGGFGLQAVQTYYARAAHRLQHESTEPDPDSSGQEGDHELGFAATDEYDPGISEPVGPVLDLTLNDPPYGRGGQEYYAGFEDLDY